MSRPAPIVRLTLAYAVGVAAGLAGAPWWVAPLGALLASVAPNPTSVRPASRWILAVVVATGLGAGGAAGTRDPACVTQAAAGTQGTVRGRFLARPRGGAAPFQPANGCGPITVVVEATPAEAHAGEPIEVSGTWRRGRARPWMRAGTLTPIEAPPPTGGWERLSWIGVRWRDVLVGRLHRLFPRHGPLVSALVLARAEGLSPDLRASFAITGIAHLLAISGFHVGLIAGLFYSGLRATGRERRRSLSLAALLAWVYVGLIGFPDAACRAALILSFAAASRLKGRPPSRWGPLAAAGLVLLVQEPARLASPGFQLSFAGAAGLVAWARSMEGALDRVSKRAIGRFGVGRAAPQALMSGLAAGVAATLATAPVVAWHFERLSLVGIPMSLVATPLVSLALPASIATLLLDFAAPRAAVFLAGGTGTFFDLLVQLTDAVGRLPWASVWTSRPTVIACLAGASIATLTARAPGIGATARRRLVLLYVASAMVAWPALVALDGRGRLEIVMIDVGQGDAIAVRSPQGRWLLVDAGPPDRRGSSGAHPVVRTLRARGARRLEALILTHPDLDHIGGAAAVLEFLPPRVVMDPMLPAPKTGYADLVDEARARGIPWVAARAGDHHDLDGVSVEVLHPADLPVNAEDGNAASVVVLLEWNGFRALLTGDAYVDVERGIAERVGDIDVLKVGHHGSDTSTDPEFLARIRPEIALVSAGSANRYGHPTPAVVDRLRRAGADVLRTDEHGTVRVVVRRSGGYRAVWTAKLGGGAP